MLAATSSVISRGRVGGYGQFLAMPGPSPGQSFCFADGRPLNTPAVVLHSAFPSTFSSYSGHSFQIGAATTAASQGLLDYLIRALGLWFSDTVSAHQIKLS